MNIYSIVWKAIGTLVTLFSFLVVCYYAIVVEEPTNSDLSEMIFFGLVCILWKINQVSEKEE